MKSQDEGMRRASIELIQRLVADKFGLTVDQLLGASTRRDVAIPRQIAMYLAKQATDASLPEIGSYFGGKHHTTVMHSIAKIEEQRRADTNVRSLIEDLLATIAQSTPRCHSCLETKGLLACMGNSRGPCQRGNLLCSVHAELIHGQAQCLECYESMPWGFGSAPPQGV